MTLRICVIANRANKLCGPCSRRGAAPSLPCIYGRKSAGELRIPITAVHLWEYLVWGVRVVQSLYCGICTVTCFAESSPLRKVFLRGTYRADRFGIPRHWARVLSQPLFKEYDTEIEKRAAPCRCSPRESYSSGNTGSGLQRADSPCIGANQ
jgi:hypothetical protein